MVKKQIQMQMVRKRAMCTEGIDSNYSTLNGNRVLKSISEGVDYSSSLQNYFNECAYNNSMANANAKLMIDVLSSIQEDTRFKSYLNIYCENIIPSCKDLDGLEIAIESSSLNEEAKECCKKCIEDNKACCRVINNNQSISQKIEDLPGIMHFCNIKGKYENLTEAVCDTVDKYNMGLKKKFNASLEEALYLCSKCGYSDTKNIVESVTDYYLRKDIISDMEMDGIRDVLKTNPFLSESDISELDYVFDESNSFVAKLSFLAEASKMGPKYRDLVDQISTCKTLKKAKALGNLAADLIISTFVIAGTATIIEVTGLITALVGFASIPVIGAAETIKILTGVSNRLNDNKKKLSDADKIRTDKVIKKIETSANKLSKKEAANFIDQAVDDYEKVKDKRPINEPDNDEFSFLMNDKVVKETKEFAESDDIKDLINKYKAEQNKTDTKLQKLVNRIYTKKPEQIIDNLPNLFGLIRGACILGTSFVPIVGPGIAITSFCADKFIEMNLKRKEAERTLAFFEKERDNMKDKLDKTKDEAKAHNLDEYIQCLDKCIDRLEDYRDNLYTDKELDRIKGYEEACCTEKITIDEYMKSRHENVCHYVNRAEQLLCNEFIRRGITPSDSHDAFTSYYNDRFEDVSTEDFVKTYVNADGIINIPLYKFDCGSADDCKVKFANITDMCCDVNQYLPKSYQVNNFEDCGVMYITFNYLIPIYTDNINTDYSNAEELKESLTNINFFAEAVDELDSYSPSTIVSELCENINIFSEAELEDITDLLELSGLDYTQFAEEVDLSYLNPNIDELKSLSENCTLFENTLSNIEAVGYLRDIVNEAKETKEKGAVLGKVKSKIDEKKDAIKGKIDSGKKIASSKVDIAKGKANLAAGKVYDKVKKGNNTAKLGAEVAKKKVVAASTKEKEISRNIDISMSSMKKSIDNALTSNRREAIIKGSVIPSFSRIIKFAIAGGVAFAINPGIAAVGAIGAFARSKHLTRKERKLMIDEIDVELQVVEKEIENADRDGNIDKYRKLLMLKKKLRRERQKLLYNMKVYYKDTPENVDEND